MRSPARERFNFFLKGREIKRYSLKKGVSGWAFIVYSLLFFVVSRKDGKSERPEEKKVAGRKTYSFCKGACAWIGVCRMCMVLWGCFNLMIR